VPATQTRPGQNPNPTPETVDRMDEAVAKSIELLALSPEPRQVEAAVAEAAAGYSEPMVIDGNDPQDLSALLAVALKRAGLEIDPDKVVAAIMAQSKPVRDVDGELGVLSSAQDQERYERVRAKQEAALSRGSGKEASTRLKFKTEPRVTVNNPSEVLLTINGVKVAVKAGAVTVPISIAHHIEDDKRHVSSARHYTDWLKNQPNALINYDAVYGRKLASPIPDGQDFAFIS